MSRWILNLVSTPATPGRVGRTADIETANVELDETYARRTAVRGSARPPRDARADGSRIGTDAAHARLDSSSILHDEGSPAERYRLALATVYGIVKRARTTSRLTVRRGGRARPLKSTSGVSRLSTPF